MKKVLFVLQSVRAGGSTTSLLNLLQLFSERGYKFDLFLQEHDGIFLERAAEVANLLPEEPVIAAIRCPKSKLKEKGWFYFAIRVLYVLCHRLFGSKQVGKWFDRYSAEKLSDKYDVVIAYQESLATEYASYIQAPKRMAWCHSDYERFSIRRTQAEQQRVYDCYQEIVCVSRVARDSMLLNLNIDANHLHLIYNVIPEQYIREMASAYSAGIDSSKCVLVSMGRFVQIKRFDRIVKVAKRLRMEGKEFIWYILGNGEEFEVIERSIRDYGLKDSIKLLGMKENPFPYVARADCFVMSSLNEAQPMVLNEALTLGIPVITTDFSSSREVVADEINGLIVSNSTEGLFEGVSRYINDAMLRERLRKGAMQFVYDNTAIMEKVLSLIE